MASDETVRALHEEVLRLQRRVRELEAANGTDSLTGLLNREGGRRARLGSVWVSGSGSWTTV